MKKRIKRILSSVLVAVMLVTSIPSAVYAADAGTANPEKLELSDEYIKVTVSGENGGFLIDTLEGDKLEKADNNKFLLYPAEDYDTSYTSIRVTRKNGDEAPLIEKTEYPVVQGVIVLCSGGHRAAIKEQVIKAVSTVLNIPAADIYVGKYDPNYQSP